MASMKCSKCGTDLNDDCMVVWNCPECGKAFKVNFSRLEKMQEWKIIRENISLNVHRVDMLWMMVKKKLPASVPLVVM